MLASSWMRLLLDKPTQTSWNEWSCESNQFNMSDCSVHVPFLFSFGWFASFEGGTCDTSTNLDIDTVMLDGCEHWLLTSAVSTAFVCEILSSHLTPPACQSGCRYYSSPGGSARETAETLRCNLSPRALLIGSTSRPTKMWLKWKSQVNLSPLAPSTHTNTCGCFVL